MEQFSLEKYLENSSRKVVTRSGHNVRILCTDQRGNMPIVALVEFETLDGVQLFYHDGKNESHREYDLFFADEEDELTEFERELQTIISEASHWTSDDGSISTYCQFGDKEIKRISAQILDLAKKEICLTCKEYSRGYQEGLKLGREDVLKDLPKLEKSKACIDPTIPVMYANTASMKTYVEYNGYKLCINDMFEKLPKEE
jgi:hypothetical protein